MYDTTLASLQRTSNSVFVGVLLRERSGIAGYILTVATSPRGEPNWSVVNHWASSISCVKQAAATVIVERRALRWYCALFRTMRTSCCPRLTLICSGSLSALYSTEGPPAGSMQKRTLSLLLTECQLQLVSFTVHCHRATFDIESNWIQDIVLFSFSPEHPISIHNNIIIYLCYS